MYRLPCGVVSSNGVRVHVQKAACPNRAGNGSSKEAAPTEDRELEEKRWWTVFCQP